MKSQLGSKKSIIIAVVCLLSVVIALIAIFIVVNRNDVTEVTNGENDKISDNKTRIIHIYTVDLNHCYMIEKYAKEHWDFDYKLDIYDNSLVYSTENVVDLIIDKLKNDPKSIDIYSVPLHATEFIKGELADYACSYTELGIDLDTAIRRADIPSYAIDSGSNSLGELIHLPFVANVSLFSYRRSVAKEVWGTDDPDEINNIIGGGTNSWDNFKQAAKSLKEHGYYIVPGISDLIYSVGIKNSLYDNRIIWEEYMDLSKYMYDNGFIKDTESWTEQWFMDLDNDENKIFGYITITDLYQYLNLDNTAGDWAVCMAPYNIVHDNQTGFIVSKNSAHKDIIGSFIEWLTLDSSETGYQYRMATGTFDDEEKISVISGTVLKNADSSRDFLGGQNINPIVYEALHNLFSQSYSGYETEFYYWQKAIRSYLLDGKPKELVIQEFESMLHSN